MRQILLALAATILLAMPAKANEDAIQSVISSQIAAFQADDFTKAFTFASPTIQQIFGSPEQFGTMVREGYPMVWRPSEVTFLSVETIDGLLWQTVMVRDQAGAVHLLDYQMVELEDGWKINAVRKRRGDDGLA